MKLYEIPLYFAFLTYLFILRVDCQQQFDYRKTPEKIFAGCLTTKYCYSPEDRDVPDDDPNCIESADCRHLIAIGGGQDGDTNSEDQMVFEMYAESKAWIGIGFSHDKKMGNEYVIACLRPNISSVKATGTIVSERDIKPVVRNSWNAPVGKGNRNIVKFEEIKNIQVKEVFVSTLAIYCKFYLKKKFVKIDPFENKAHNFDLSKKYCMLVAWSDYFFYKINPTAVDPIGEHFMRTRNKDNLHTGGQKPCKDFKTLDTVYQPTANQKKYFKLHGSCMIVVWIFLIPVGNFIGSFFKDIYKERRTCKMKTWLMLHCIFNTLALVPAIAGVCLHFVGQSGWKNHGSDLVHLVGGYSVVALYVIGFASGIFLKIMKPKLLEPGSTKMHYPTFIHEISSHAAQFLATLVIAWSPELQFSNLSCHFSYVVIGWMILYIFLCVIMAFHKFWGPSLALETEDMDDPLMRLSRMDALLTDGKVDDVEDHPNTIRLKTKALITFAFVAFFMALALIAMLAWPPVGPCFNKESDDFFEKQAYARYVKQSTSGEQDGWVDDDDDFSPKRVTLKRFIPFLPSMETTPDTTTAPTTTPSLVVT